MDLYSLRGLGYKETYRGEVEGIVMRDLSIPYSSTWNAVNQGFIVVSLSFTWNVPPLLKVYSQVFILHFPHDRLIFGSFILIST